MRLYHGSLEHIEAFDQKTLHLILPSKVALVMDLLSKSSGEDPVALMKEFYSSKTYEELRDESSKYWWFSLAELCELYRRELSTIRKPKSNEASKSRAVQENSRALHRVRQPRC